MDMDMTWTLDGIAAALPPLVGITHGTPPLPLLEGVCCCCCCCIACCGVVAGDIG